MLALPFPLAIFLSSLWSPPFPLHAPTLILLPLAKVQLSPTLTLSSLMIWYSGQTALFLFSLARAALAYLPTAFSVALRPLFHFRQAQYVQVFLLKPAPFCTLFSGLGSTNKSAISPLFSYYLTFVLSSYLKLCQELSSLSSCSIRLQWVPGHSFLPGIDVADELARRRALLAPSAISCVFSSLISRIHSFLVSDCRRTASSKFFNTQVPSVSSGELVLSCHTVFSLVCAATDTAFC